MGLNLDGIGNYDDEAYVRLYVWDHNGFGRYDASQLVIRTVIQSLLTMNEEKIYN